ncbi:MAG: hypothetical protein IT355_01585 [Gemmatimonadaceae bacterium]|nr:hypothetical protein [Gemmatimonadaceae bacterium]
MLGGIVGFAVCVGMALGYKPSVLPSAWIDLAVFKLAIIASGALFVAGATLGRAAMQSAEHCGVQRDAERFAALDAGAPRKVGASCASEREDARSRL